MPDSAWPSTWRRVGSHLTRISIAVSHPRSGTFSWASAKLVFDMPSLRIDDGTCVGRGRALGSSVPLENEQTDGSNPMLRSRRADGIQRSLKVSPVSRTDKLAEKKWLSRALSTHRHPWPNSGSTLCGETPAVFPDSAGNRARSNAIR